MSEDRLDLSAEPEFVNDPYAFLGRLNLACGGAGVQGQAQASSKHGCYTT
jgi:hypothetical protein